MKTLHRRPVRRARAKDRGIARPALTLALAGVTVAATGVVALGPAGPAQAVPERVLQSVAVDIGPDGQVRAITSRAIRDAGGEVSEEVTDLAADELSRQLPLRVQTAWRLGDRTGTDLSEIEGEAGRVVVELTVQNTTVRPRKVSYDSGGVSKSRYALVGTPLTVVAAADLGKDTHGTVVMQDDVTPDTVTNGVLGRGADDSAEVQWATMLAPPRLGASATLRLVQDTDDFQPPRFDLSVQPGLVTDASTRRLLEAAFAEESDSTLSMEGRTLDLVGSVSTILVEASTVLGQIRTELDAAGQELGARTISDLQASSSSISSSMSGISADLDSLSGEMDAQLESSGSTAVEALKKSVDDVRDLLGDPRTTLPPIDQVEGCRVLAPGDEKSATVMAQLAAVGGQLESLAAATGACRDRIADELASTVGVVGADGTCAPVGSAACLLQSVGTALTEQLAALETFRDGLAARFDETLVGSVRQRFGELDGLFQALREDLEDLESGGTGTIDQSLGNVIEGLTGTLEWLRPEDETMPGLAANLETIAESLDTQVDQLEGALAQSFGRSPVEQALDVRALACTVPPGETPPVTADQISRIAVGVPCADPVDPAGTFPAGTLAARFAALSQTATSLDDLAGLVHDASDAADTIADGVEGSRDQLSALLGGPSSDLNASVVELVCSVQALSTPTADLPGSCGIPEEEQTTDPAPLQRLGAAVDEIWAKQGTLSDEEIKSAFSTAVGLLQGSITEAGEGAGQVAGAGGAAQTRVSALIDDLEAQLDGTGQSVLVDGRDVVRDQRRSLNQSVREADERLDGAAAKALRSIEADVNSANRNVSASERQLLADLRKVLVDLGERRNNGTGLLGSLVTGATSAGVSDDQIRRANQTAVAFGRVRGQDIDALLMEQAQTAVALRLQSEFPAFGIDLPAGSRQTTVFAYRVLPDGA
jgi:hypothetical protein